MGFNRIMAEDDGPAIYGIFHCFVGACSQHRLPRHGWMTDTGRSDGTPWEFDDLALKFHRKAAEIERALQVLCMPKVGWIAKYEVDDIASLEKAAVEANKKVRIYAGGGGRVQDGEAGEGCIRKLWQVRKDIATARDVIERARKQCGQTKADDGRWTPKLIGENAARVLKLKEQLKTLEIEEEEALKRE
jgi:hypothetical protein